MAESFKEHILYRMSKGEKVACYKCKSGYYITNEKDIKHAKYIHCNKCDSWIEFLPSYVVVE